MECVFKTIKQTMFILVIKKKKTSIPPFLINYGRFSPPDVALFHSRCKVVGMEPHLTIEMYPFQVRLYECICGTGCLVCDRD